MDFFKNEKVMLAICGVLAAAVAIMLIVFGNPGNMAICVACFIRDSAGAMGLHSAEKLQYLRPEIPCIVLGAFLAAVAGKEFKTSSGSSPFTRFILGIIVMIGCLMFLGCPLRMVLRMAGGDLNAWVALIGFAVGILVGVLFLKKGFSLGRAAESEKKAEGYAFPIAALIVLCLSLGTTIFAASTEGPGSIHVPAILSIVAGLVFGAAAQKSRMCFAGGLRDAFMVRDFNGLVVIGILFAGVLITNLVLGKFSLGFVDQPIAHTDALWNILGMFVVGFGATLMGGCPLRQLVLAGQGNGDAAVGFLGLLVGAAFCHNFGLASSADGPTFAGQIAVVCCIVALLAIALAYTKKSE